MAHHASGLWAHQRLDQAIYCMQTLQCSAPHWGPAHCLSASGTIARNLHPKGEGRAERSAGTLVSPDDVVGKGTWSASIHRHLADCKKFWDKAGPSVTASDSSIVAHNPGQTLLGLESTGQRNSGPPSSDFWCSQRCHLRQQSHCNGTPRLGALELHFQHGMSGVLQLACSSNTSYQAPVQLLGLGTCHDPVQLMGQGLVLLQACRAGQHHMWAAGSCLPTRHEPLHFLAPSVCTHSSPALSITAALSQDDKGVYLHRPQCPMDFRARRPCRQHTSTHRDRHMVAH